MQTTTFNDTIIITTGASAKAKAWTPKTTTWMDFVLDLHKPVVTGETMEEYRTMSPIDRTAAKDVGGFVGGEFTDMSRGKDKLKSRRLICLDLDNCASPDMVFELFQIVFNCAGIMHSTHGSRPDKPRCRLIVPTTSNVGSELYTRAANYIMDELGREMFDATSAEPNRLMFWPSIPCDANYFIEVNQGPAFDCQKLQAVDREAEQLEAMVKANMPSVLTGVPGKFCQKYNIHDTIAAFLPGVYTPAGADRYHFGEADSSAGAVVYENGACLFSHHAKDPAGGKVRNPFELVRIHKFGYLDADVEASLTTKQLPSYKAMIDWIEQEGICDVDRWLEALKVNPKGIPMATIANMQSIIEHDPELSQGSLFYDQFADKLMVAGDFPWLGFVDRQSFVWNDLDDSGIRAFLEEKYGMCDISKVNDAVSLAANKNRIHPVKEYLNGLTWDGLPRLDTVFADFLNAERNEYTYSVTRKSLVGAVARIMQPGCKHDHILVLVGPQGCRKSSTIAKLGGDWYSDSLHTMQGKEAYESLQGNWIIEVGEMSAAKKTEVDSMKHFISKTADNYRAAYARRTVNRPRQCAFFGTTNEEEFIQDATGGRRFWPLKVSAVPVDTYDLLNKAYIDQIWAEAVQAYKDGEKWYLDPAMEELAKKEQEKHTASDSRTDMALEFLNKPVPEGWYSMPRSHRLQLVNADLTEGDTMLRDRVCAVEVWVEMLHGELKDFHRGKAAEVNTMLRKLPGFKPSIIDFGPGYGKQKGFARITAKNFNSKGL
jgi:predicted P-loop ATPase